MKSCITRSSQKSFYTGGEEHLSTSVVGDIIKNDEKGRFIIVTNNRGDVWKSGITSQIVVKQNNQLLVQIS